MVICIMLPFSANAAMATRWVGVLRTCA